MGLWVSLDGLGGGSGEHGRPSPAWMGSLFTCDERPETGPSNAPHPGRRPAGGHPGAGPPASKRTIADRLAEPEGDFRTAYEKGRSLLNSSLRRKQIQVAMTGNVAMLIWLGKQHLAQADRQDTRISVTPEEVARMSDEELTRMLEEARLQSAGGRGGSGR